MLQGQKLRDTAVCQGLGARARRGLRPGDLAPGSGTGYRLAGLAPLAGAGNWLWEGWKDPHAANSGDAGQVPWQQHLPGMAGHTNRSPPVSLRPPIDMDPKEDVQGPSAGASGGWK